MFELIFRTNEINENPAFYFCRKFILFPWIIDQDIALENIVFFVDTFLQFY